MTQGRKEKIMAKRIYRGQGAFEKAKFELFRRENTKWQP